MVENIIFTVAGLGIIYWMYFEFQKYSTQDLLDENLFPYSQKRFKRRMVVSFLFLVIIILLALRETITGIFDSKLFVLFYVSFILLVVFYIVLLAIADGLESTKQITQIQDDMLQQSAKEISDEILKSEKVQEMLKQQEIENPKMKKKKK